MIHSAWFMNSKVQTQKFPYLYACLRRLDMLCAVSSYPSRSRVVSVSVSSSPSPLLARFSFLSSFCSPRDSKSTQRIGWEQENKKRVKVWRTLEAIAISIPVSCGYCSTLPGARSAPVRAKRERHGLRIFAQGSRQELRCSCRVSVFPFPCAIFVIYFGLSLHPSFLCSENGAGTNALLVPGNRAMSWWFFFVLLSSLGLEGVHFFEGIRREKLVHLFHFWTWILTRSHPCKRNISDDIIRTFSGC